MSECNLSSPCARQSKYEHTHAYTHVHMCRHLLTYTPSTSVGASVIQFLLDSMAASLFPSSRTRHAARLRTLMIHTLTKFAFPLTTPHDTYVRYVAHTQDLEYFIYYKPVRTLSNAAVCCSVWKYITAYCRVLTSICLCLSLCLFMFVLCVCLQARVREINRLRKRDRERGRERRTRVAKEKNERENLNRQKKRKRGSEVEKEGAREGG